MKNKKLYCKTELAGNETFKLTKEGMSIPKVFESYLKYFNIKKENVFEYSGDCDIDTEFNVWASKTISEKMKEKGATDVEIKETTELFLNIDEMRAVEKD